MLAPRPGAYPANGGEGRGAGARNQAISVGAEGRFSQGGRRPCDGLRRHAAFHFERGGLWFADASDDASAGGGAGRRREGENRRRGVRTGLPSPRGGGMPDRRRDQPAPLPIGFPL